MDNKTADIPVWSVKKLVPVINVSGHQPPRLGRPDVRYGSLADIAAVLPNVRFDPDSGHQRQPLLCPLSAKSRHRPDVSARRVADGSRGSAEY